MGQTHNVAKFRRAPRTCATEISLVEKITLPRKVGQFTLDLQICYQSIGRERVSTL